VTSPYSAVGAPAARPALILDALGKKCPIPIIMLADRIRDVRIGQTIAVLADDPAAKTDLPAWCALKSQEFVRADDLSAQTDPAGPPPRAGWAFLVRRSY
jgi:tRNA 2-thiouridine synthesizing protein A